MMKRKTAKEILAESFRELAEKKPVDKITVPEIVENCGYSKTTFYREFRDKYDLMAWDYTKRLELIMDQTASPDHEWKTTLLEGAYLFYEQRDYLKNLLLHTNGYESFSRHMKQSHFESLKKCVLDGPSAGITLTTAIALLITGNPVDSHIAMTGEISLRGEVTAIGGLPEKLMAAQRAGVKKVLIPSENVEDLEDVPQETRDSLQITPVRDVDEVLALCGIAVL